jgi:hypothetical protein
VSRSMIVGIDNYPESVKPKNCWHEVNDITILSG